MNPDYNLNMSTLFDKIEKPTLLINETVARRNIQRIAEKVRAQQIRFRPHFKTHQSDQIGEWFRAEGVTAITTSSVDMAIYFAGHGWDDITIAFPANLRQSLIIADLAQQIRLGLLVESVETVEALAQAVDAPVDIWIKTDVGAHRTGLAWDDFETAARVAGAVNCVPHFRLRGLLTHAGHTYTARGREEVCRRSADSTGRINQLRDRLHEKGLGPLEVSIGDTPAASICDDLGAVDEIRPGNFVFYDAQQVQIGSCDWSDVAVALACPVVARHPERGEVVVYGGAVHLSKDFVSADDQRHFGLVCLPTNEGWSAPLPGAYVSALSQEHGMLHLPADSLAQVKIGDLLCILPAHSCLTVTLMRNYLSLSNQVITTLNS